MRRTLTQTERKRAKINTAEVPTTTIGGEFCSQQALRRACRCVCLMKRGCVVLLWVWCCLCVEGAGRLAAAACCVAGGRRLNVVVQATDSRPGRGPRLLWSRGNAARARQHNYLAARLPGGTIRDNQQQTHPVCCGLLPATHVTLTWSQQMQSRGPEGTVSYPRAGRKLQQRPEACIFNELGRQHPSGEPICWHGIGYSRAHPSTCCWRQPGVL
jgi:hypothetical protein